MAFRGERCATGDGCGESCGNCQLDGVGISRDPPWHTGDPDSNYGVGFQVGRLTSHERHLQTPSLPVKPADVDALSTRGRVRNDLNRAGVPLTRIIHGPGFRVARRRKPTPIASFGVAHFRESGHPGSGTCRGNPSRGAAAPRSNGGPSLASRSCPTLLTWPPLRVARKPQTGALPGSIRGCHGLDP